MAGGDNDCGGMAVEEEKEVAERGEKKTRKIADFFPTLTLNFFMLNAWNGQITHMVARPG
jgi:hypothetical protein